MKTLLLILAFSSFMFGCSNAPSEADVEASVEARLSIAITETAARPTTVEREPTPESTETPVPTASSTPTLAPSSTPTIASPIVEIAPLTELREGAGQIFDSLRYITSGATARVIGITEDGSWYQVALESDPEEVGWVMAKDAELVNEMSLDGLPVATSAPTPTPIPTVTPRLESAVVTGTGDTVVDLQDYWPEGEPAVMHISTSSGSNFIVENYDDDGRQMELLVNAIGPYEGYIPLDFYDSETTARLQIQASGPWSIELLPLHSGRLHWLDVPGTYEGVGDDVVFVSGDDPDIAEIQTISERGNFVVWSIGRETGGDLLVNEIAPYEGTIILPRDTLVLIINAPDSWSITVTGR